MDKIDYKKEYKSLYSGKKGVFNILEIPKMKYIQIHGTGNPNTDPTYGSSVEALYSVAYTIKGLYKKKEQDFVVMPLEGLWYAEDYSVFTSREKEKWQWTMIIMMPHFVTEEDFMESAQIAIKKKEIDKIKELSFIEYNEGIVVQTLHIGSYDDEAPAIEEMHKFVIDQGYKLSGKHHEIYLSDPRKVQAEKLKTILRQPITK